ncbi:MAG: hypothetical protein QXS20_03195 [Candidatus Thorarchaeota archaeon]
MDSRAWRLELDNVAEIKTLLLSVDKSAEEQLERQVRHLYDTFANLSRTENDLALAGVLKKRKIQAQYEKIQSQLQDDFERFVRDLGERFRRLHRDAVTLLPRIRQLRPSDPTEFATMTPPAVNVGDSNDAKALREFAEAFAKRYGTVYQAIARDTKTLLEENKRIVETYERHVTIDRKEVSTTISLQDIGPLALSEMITINDKLRAERSYLDSRKGEVGHMLGASLMSDIESLQAFVETASRFGLDLPIDFSQKLHSLARQASTATDLTTQLSLEGQLSSARDQMASLLRDRIINMKHEVTQKIVAGGIPTTSDILPTPPQLSVETKDVPNLLSAYQKMLEWEGQVRLALKEKVEDLIDEIAVALDFPADAGIVDLPGTAQFVMDSRNSLGTADIDTLVKTYLKARSIRDELRKNITERIREYIQKFQELASSADRVLDYAQLSKKVPKIEETEGTIAYLLQSLTSLKSAVDSGVATFRNACLQELDAIVEDLQTIKPAYAEIFVPIITDLEDSESRIKQMDDFSKIRLEMRTIKDTILVKAKEAIENLRYRLGVKIRLAAAKLMGAGVEIPPEVQEGITELNSVGLGSENVFSLPSVARKMIEVYEKKISSKVIAQLNASVTGLMESLKRAQSIGVDVDKELELLESIKNSPSDELERAAEDFDKLMNLTTSQMLHRKIRIRADQAYVQLKGALSVFEQLGMSDLVERLNVLIEKVPEQLEKESKHVNEALEVCLTLANIQDEMLKVIKTMSVKDGERHDKEIRQRSKYYPTIERVYLKHPKEFSRLVFDLDRMKELEKSLQESTTLDQALGRFTELKALRSSWLEKAEKMDDWHKSLKMFLTGYSPTAPPDQREKFLDETSKKIRDTYGREDISTYLIWALRELTLSMSGAKQ